MRKRLKRAADKRSMCVAPWLFIGKILSDLSEFDYADFQDGFLGTVQPDFRVTRDPGTDPGTDPNAA
jgi:hypothetical protein